MDEAIPLGEIPESENSNTVQAEREARRFLNLNKEHRFDEQKCGISYPRISYP